MEIREGRYTKLAVGKGNQQILLIAKSGYGKTLATESIVEEYHNRGYLVIIMEDVKDEFEFAYAMFEPKAQYHLNLLERYGKKAKKQQVKIYHPFTFNLPKKKLLPEMEIYGLPLKGLGRDELSMLLEEKRDSETIRILLDNMEHLGKQDGLFDFMFNVEKSMKSETKSIGRYRIAKPKSGFWISTPSVGTRTNLAEIVSHFKPFLTDLFLMPEEFELNLDFKKIYQDRENYHFFTTKWIKDPKIRYFIILYLFNKFIQFRDECNYPVCFVFEEVRKLVPENAEGYKTYLADSLRDKLSTIRNKGRGGCSTVMNSQVWADIDDDVKESATETYFGSMGGVKDINKVCKALSYSNDTKFLLNVMDRCEFIKKGAEEYGTFTFLPPSHMHAEEEYSFMDIYRKHHKDKLKHYNTFIDKMTLYKRESSRKIKDIVETRIKRLEEEHRARQEQLDKKERIKEELQELKQEIKSGKKDRKETLLPVIIEEIKMLREERKRVSIREIAKKHNIPSATLHHWLKNALKKNKEIDTPV